MEDINIIYEDGDMVVCVKRPGVPSQQDVSGTPDMESLITRYLRRTSAAGSAGLVHRLDRETGGIMVFGKRAAATAKLCMSVKDKESTVKEYLAAVSGTVAPDMGTWTDRLKTNRSAGKTFVTDSSDPDGKDAELWYETIGKEDHPLYGDLTLVRVGLLTGRTHQIRAQFSSRGYPLLGDGKYGSRVKIPIALWAWRLCILHPSTGRIMEFRYLPDEGPLASLLSGEQVSLLQQVR
ncbi:MAG: RluA family pseudouridine synthase [Clostridia bacterium]|nr:RluA family pseudouridine synthase [Clostridia bacterium]